jgi:hypothetical protein
MATHPDGMTGPKRLPACPRAESDLEDWTAAHRVGDDGATALTMAPLQYGTAGPAHDARSEYRVDIRGAQP